MFGDGESSEMGYDMGITVFSPAGRLYQVEYATEAIKQGTTAIGIRTDEGVVLLAEKRVSKLQIAKTVQKIFMIDTHVGAAIAGLTADAMVLIDHARVQSQINRLSYEEPIDILMLVKRICELKQMYTHHAGVRPFGVAFLIAGIDSAGPRLYMTAPSGAFSGYYVQAIGAGTEQVMEQMQDKEKGYRPDLTLDESITLGLVNLKNVITDEFNEQKVGLAIIRTEDKVLRALKTEEIKEHISTI